MSTEWHRRFFLFLVHEDKKDWEKMYHARDKELNEEIDLLTKHGGKKLLWLDDVRDPYRGMHLTRHAPEYMSAPESDVIWVQSYHSFVNWIKKLLSTLKEKISNAIIVMDNARYHKKLLSGRTGRRKSSKMPARNIRFLLEKRIQK